MKKLTHEDAERNLLAKGIEVKMLERFVDRKTKMKFKCVCGKVFETTYACVIQGCRCGCKKEEYIGKRYNNVVVLEKTNKSKYDRPLYKCRCDCGKEFLCGIAMLRSGDRISCGCQRKIDITGLRSGRLLVIRCIDKKDNRGNYLWECKCDCGNIINVAATYLTSKKTQSCGCLRDEKNHESKCYKDYSGQTFDYLYVKEKLTEKNISSNYLYLCECKCGNVIKTTSDRLLCGDIKSCGCRPRKDILGQKFGKLIVKKLMKKRNKFSKRIWKCKCECGKISYVETSKLINGRTKSCGNCGLYVNGVRVSRPQLLLHKMLSRGVLNYKTKCGLVPDIALVYNGRKIAIEYDEKHWHNEEEDLTKTKRLLKDGWKVIRVLVNNVQPNKPIIDFILDTMNIKCDYAKQTIQ